MATLGTPANTIEILQKYQFHFQKKFGQNFLIDPHVLKKIMDKAEISKDDCIVEIGPGIGTMTQYLAENARQVIAIEIDQNLIPILQDTLSDYQNVMVINEDVLKVDMYGLIEEKNQGKPIKVVANLPYYITSPILMYLLEGFLLGFAAMFMLSRLRGCNSTMGEGTLMEAIAAAVIGGVSMSGGKGSVIGIFLGMLLIGVVNNSLNLLQVDSFWKYIIMGAIIVLAVFVSNIGKKKR